MSTRQLGASPGAIFTPDLPIALSYAELSAGTCLNCAKTCQRETSSSRTRVGCGLLMIGSNNILGAPELLGEREGNGVARFVCGALRKHKYWRLQTRSAYSAPKLPTRAVRGTPQPRVPRFESSPIHNPWSFLAAAVAVLVRVVMGAWTGGVFGSMLAASDQADLKTSVHRELVNPRGKTDDLVGQIVGSCPECGKEPTFTDQLIIASVQNSDDSPKKAGNLGKAYAIAS
ncbi:hypothetical protein DFP72DRAFT_844004 [Ephemerocybe angulata]|uniref:Uncharacterized protein n=1 Tax=Ephemerocybe angulata TaxID=980116 RepID=A0A8H6I8R3_9AGAR|nr:hypothetical protein DFP72DRAFT_844004 [Tulosesus angulatus]